MLKKTYYLYLSNIYNRKDHIVTYAKRNLFFIVDYTVHSIVKY